MTVCRLLLDPPAPGDWNMAVDEVLLEWSAATRGCCWRFYRWSEPTLSLGYFQPYEQRDHHAASRHCAVVRRASGGGAILHDAELTYSIVVPLTHPLAKRRRSLYEAVHEALIEALAQLGIAATLCKSAGREQPAQPFLCFQRRADGDVLVGSTKIAGSAQRRNRGAVLQHGSVLLSRSPAAPELCGLDEFLPGPIEDGDIIGPWLETLARRLRLTWKNEPLCPEERTKANSLAALKYASEEWVRYRGRLTVRVR